MTESSMNSAPQQKAPSERAVPAAAPPDKRQYPRFKIEGTTTSLGKPGFLASLGLGRIQHAVVNLSQGGAMVKYTKRLPVDSQHELRIEIPKYKEVIDAVGVIRWCAQSAKKESDIYLGIQFVELPAPERRKLISMYELFSSTEYKAKAAARKDASAVFLKAPRS